MRCCLVVKIHQKSGKILYGKRFRRNGTKVGEAGEQRCLKRIMAREPVPPPKKKLLILVVLNPGCT